MKRKILSAILIGILLITTGILAGCQKKEKPEADDEQENRPPVIEVISPWPLNDTIKKYYDARLCARVTDPDADIMAVQFYLKKPYHIKWKLVYDEIAFNDTHCYPEVAYDPVQDIYKPQIIQWRIEVTDGKHLVSETYNISYWYL